MKSTNQITIGRCNNSCLDIGSQHYDIELNVPVGHYIVATASYFEIAPVVCSRDNAISEYKDLKNLGYPAHILDHNNNDCEPTYDCDGEIDGFETII